MISRRMFVSKPRESERGRWLISIRGHRPGRESCEEASRLQHDYRFVCGVVARARNRCAGVARHLCTVAEQECIWQRGGVRSREYSRVEYKSVDGCTVACMGESVVGV